MLTSITVFIFITAFIIAGTRVVLSIMKERDKAMGKVIEPETYRIGGLIRRIFRDSRAERKLRKAKK